MIQASEREVSEAPKAAAAPALPAAPVVYDHGRLHSPLPPQVIEKLRAIHATNPALRADVFMKVGDSVTESAHALGCFARGPDVLGDHRELGAVIERFRAGSAAGSNPFARASRTARSGWSAWQALYGKRPPLEAEVDEIAPRYALVQFGTNDVQIGSLHHFADRLWDIVDVLEARGVVPILFTIMARADRAEARQRVPWYNAAIRAVATAHQTPLVDYHAALAALPGEGLAADGVHPSVGQGVDACTLTAAGLRFGFNVRNLLALQALDRVGRALATPEALDAPDVLAGDGSGEDPFVVPELPLVSARTLPLDGPSRHDGYRGCPVTRATRGPEHWYRIELGRRTTLRAIGFDRGPVELDLVLLGADRNPERCLARGRRMLLATLPPGTYHLVVDAERGAAGQPPTKYALALLSG